MRISLLVAALAASSCSVLPPSLRTEAEAQKAGATVMTPAQVAAAAGLKPAATPPANEPKLYPGSGDFVNQRPVPAAGARPRGGEPQLRGARRPRGRQGDPRRLPASSRTPCIRP